jgi:hypothetical protein
MYPDFSLRDRILVHFIEDHGTQTFIENPVEVETGGYAFKKNYMMPNGGP